MLYFCNYSVAISSTICLQNDGATTRGSLHIGWIGWILWSGPFNLHHRTMHLKGVNLLQQISVVIFQCYKERKDQNRTEVPDEAESRRRRNELYAQMMVSQP